MLTVSADTIHKHLHKQHSHEYCGYRKVEMQTWSTRYGNGYWTVHTPTPFGAISTPNPVRYDFVEEKLQAEHKRRQCQIENQEQAKLVTTETMVKMQTEWEEFNGFPRALNNKSLYLNWQTSLVDYGKTYHPGQKRPAMDDIITRSNLLVLHKAFDRCLRWCYDTLESTHIELREAIRSPWLDSKDKRCLKRLQEIASETKYITYWKRMITYSFRTGLMHFKDRAAKYGIKFTKKQLELIQEINRMLKSKDFAEVLKIRAFAPDETVGLENNATDPGDEIGDVVFNDPDQLLDDDTDDDLEEGHEENDATETEESDLPDATSIEDPPESFDRLAEKLLELCMEFIKQTFDNESESPLCHFLAVLGIRPKGAGFYPPYNYTPMLAGMLWVNRLLTLEYALPKRHYRTLTAWKHRSSIPLGRKRLEHLNEVRVECLLDESCTPSARMGKLMGKGIYLTKKHGRPPNIRWDKDGKTIYIKGVVCKVTDINKLVKELVKAATDLMEDELLFGTCIPPTLDLKKLPIDEMTDFTNGHWVTEKLSNSEIGGALYMIKFADTITGDKSLRGINGKDWNWKRVASYLEKKTTFLEILMAITFLTGGQPPRGPEIGSIRFRNTIKDIRNIFVDADGNVFYVISYNKSRAISNDSFHIARYLPEEVGRLLMLYTTYIRPFAHSLYNDLQRAMGKPTVDDDGDYLFCDDGKPTTCWTGPQLSKILQRETGNRLQYKINIWMWRHIAVSITRKYVKQIAAHFSRNDKECREQKLQTLNYLLDLMFAYQCGHSLLTHLTCYGINAAFNSTLQPDLLEWFRVISHAWHRHLWSVHVGKGGVDVGGSTDEMEEVELMEEFEISGCADVAEERGSRPKRSRDSCSEESPRGRKKRQRNNEFLVEDLEGGRGDTNEEPKTPLKFRPASMDELSAATPTTKQCLELQTKLNKEKEGLWRQLAECERKYNEVEDVIRRRERDKQTVANLFNE